MLRHSKQPPGLQTYTQNNLSTGKCSPNNFLNATFFFFARFWFWKKLGHFYRVRPQYLGFGPFLGYSRLKYGQIYEIALKTREGVNSTSFEWHFWNLQKKLAKKPTRLKKWFWHFGSFLHVIASSVRHQCVITPYFSRKCASFDVIVRHNSSYIWLM